MKIYLAHSLTQAPEEFKAEMQSFREQLKTQYEVLEFLGLVAGTAEDVFLHDVQCVTDCDLLLAEVSYPAIGLGFEIATALQLNKKVLAVAKADANVSRLVLGIQSKNYQFHRYHSLEEIFKMIIHD